MVIPPTVASYFEQKLNTALALIKEYGIEFQEIGIFGSYARNDYKATSDIDICIITSNRPERHISGSMRDEAEELGVDIVFVSPQYFQYSDTLFAKNLRKDYRRIL